ncbi:MAG: 5-formyltetrahydrofolate cyclo-ligase [Fusobacteriaceae bacterium]|nr:5-formyltetrahydrofolate cyclo-ligase [Fusobacteriaceae bacterium]MBN2838266.1 5-formyltetrahydrofolate cyclo-ligase [Fusobacteriaceae bacterium]
MKIFIRKSLISKREKLDKNYVKSYSESLSKIFIESDIFKESSIVMSYVSFKGEFDTNFINKEILNNNKTLLLPKIYSNSNMKAFKVKDLTGLNRNKFGILEPIESEELSPDLVIIPGVAFDYEKNRIGFGAGFYDKFLEKLDRNSVKIIALAYDFQILETIPKEDHDIPIDLIYYLDKNNKLTIVK